MPLSEIPVPYAPVVIVTPPTVFVEVPGKDTGGFGASYFADI